jgi:hypothetical protein
MFHRHLAERMSDRERKREKNYYIFLNYYVLMFKEIGHQLDASKLSASGFFFSSTAIMLK